MEFLFNNLFLLFINSIVGQSTSSSCNPGSNQPSTSAASPATSNHGNIVSPAQHHQQSEQNFYQYLTPPSQHSTGGVTPQHLTQTLDSYPTPSPESLSSGASPYSPLGWSDSQSPANNIYVTAHQSNKGSEAIYI